MYLFKYLCKHENHFIYFYIFTLSLFHFFKFHIIPFVHAMYICFVYNDELYIYALVEINIMFCSVLILSVIVFVVLTSGNVFVNLRQSSTFTEHLFC